MQPVDFDVTVMTDVSIVLAATLAIGIAYASVALPGAGTPV